MAVTTHSRKVAVLVESTTPWGREVIGGIGRYGRERGWLFFAEPSEAIFGSQFPARWSGDGVIGRITSDVSEKLKQFRGAVVDLSAYVPFKSGHPRVAADYDTAGRMAAAHLLDRGLRHFAALGVVKLPTPKLNGFIMEAKSRGYQTHLYPRSIVANDHPHWGVEQRRLLTWLDNLPKPVGVLTTYDAVGRMVIHLCMESGIRVPEEVAVIGMFNDEVICEMGSPALSSVALANDRQGYQGAMLLDQLMNGSPRPLRNQFIEPIGVIARESTDILAIDDSEVAAALRLIRTRATQGVCINDVLQDVPVSRRSLERRFQLWFGRSPAQEIRRVRIEEAKRLLRDTNLKGPTVAAMSGFSSQSHMINTFTKELGVTPSAYRRWAMGAT